MVCCHSNGSRLFGYLICMNFKLKQMAMPLTVALACLSGLFCFQCVLCEEPVEVSGTVIWRCTCDTVPLGALSYTPASNCSSCDCEPDGGGWNCSCASNGTSQASGTFHDASCFTSCNCTSGSPGTSTAKKRISSKGVVIILLLCVVLTTIAFLASIACYFYRKDKFSGKPPILSSDNETSWNSRMTLISLRSTSFPVYQVKAKSLNPLAAFLRWISFLCGSETGTLPGAIVQFSFVELEQATDKFSNANLIGVGGSSNVYRGQLQDGTAVAIKKLNLFGGPEGDYDFLTEIELISRLNHCHVVPLLGYCCEFQGKNCERLLVFDYMSNGNLRDCLDASPGKEPMDWNTRVRIVLGAARGLEYLHEAAAPRILHRDIKSTNILLDDKFRAKITDLGMAKRLMNDDLTSCSNSPARMLGTIGYFAPEYAIVGKASLKSDVFSFGVVILELITGCQPIRKAPNKPDESLVIWATGRLHNSRSVVTELPDPVLKGNFPAEEMQIMAHLARECLQWDPDSRPSMSEVVQIVSAISSDKSRKRNFPSGLVMSSSSRSIKSAPEIERRDYLVEKPNMVQVHSERMQARSSLPLAVEKSPQTVLSAECMEKLILLTSSTRSWRSSDDETVDLTEPRFESFVQPNCRSL